MNHRDTERAMTRLAKELRLRVDTLRTEAERVHNSPSIILDRDHRVMALQSRAEGVQYAAHRLLEVLESLRLPSQVAPRRRRHDQREG